MSEQCWAVRLVPLWGVVFIGGLDQLASRDPVTAMETCDLEILWPKLLCVPCACRSSSQSWKHLSFCWFSPSETPFTSTVTPTPSLLLEKPPVQPAPQLSQSPRDSPKEPGWDAAFASAELLGVAQTVCWGSLAHLLFPLWSSQQLGTLVHPRDTKIYSLLGITACVSCFLCHSQLVSEIVPNPCSLIISSIVHSERKENILQHFLQIPHFYFNFHVVLFCFFLICTLGSCFGSFIERQDQDTLPWFQSTISTSNKLQNGKTIMDVCASSLEEIFSGWDNFPLFLGINVC